MGGKRGYAETDQPQPLNYYAQTKWEAEQAVLEMQPKPQLFAQFLVLASMCRKNDLAGWILDSLKDQKPLRLLPMLFIHQFL